MQRIVDISAARRVNAADTQVAQVLSPRLADVLLRHLPGQRRYAVVYRGGEGRGDDVVLNQQHLLQCAGGALRQHKAFQGVRVLRQGMCNVYR